MDIIFLASHEFHGFIKFRPQHLAEQFACQGRVLYVEPARAYRAFKFFTWNKFAKEKDNLYLFSPIVLPFLSKFIFIRKLNQILILKSIKKLIKKLEIKDYSLFITTPFCAFAIDKLKEKTLVYDCNDDWFSIPKLPHDFLKKQEAELLKKADFCFVTSQFLYDEKSKYNKNTFIARSAADVEHFACVSGGKKICDSGGKKIIGTMGSVNNTKDDLEILDAIASCPEWSLQIVGPIMDDVDLNLYPNLRDNAELLGKKDYKELPQYVNDFDVCIIPYKINEFTLNANPTKMLEFFAQGKPVIASNLPEIRIYKDIIYIAKNKDDFLQKIREALNEDDIIKKNERIKIAKENTWDNVGDFILGKIVL